MAARPPRRRPATAAAPPTVVDGAATDYAALQREVFRAQRALARARRAPRRAGGAGARRRAGVPGVVPRRAAVGRRAGAAVDDAHRRASWRRSSATPAPVSPCCRRATPATSTPSPPPTPSCATPSSIGDAGRRRTRCPTHAWAVVHRRRRGRRWRRPRADSPAFWLYSSGTTGVPEGRDAPPRQPAGDGRDVRPRGARHRPRRPLPVGRQAVLRLRARQLADVPAGGRRDARSSTRAGRRRPRSPSSSAPSSRRCSSPAPASSPACSTPTCRQSTFASVRATVTAGEALPADLQRRFAARFGHPVLDGIGTTEALHIFLSNRTGAERPGTSGRPVPGYDGAARRRRRQRSSTGADTPGYLQVQRAVAGHRLLEPRRGDAGRVPGRVAGDGRRLHRARTTATGRSSGATAT